MVIKFLSYLTGALIVLKAADIGLMREASWGWAFAPFWIPLAFIGAWITTYTFVTLIDETIKAFKGTDDE